MKKIFISQPMGGKTISEISTERGKAAVKASQILGACEVIKSWAPDLKEALSPVEHLGRSIFMMGRADAVIFTKGWQAARGCRIEHDVAEAYGLRIVDITKV